MRRRDRRILSFAAVTLAGTLVLIGLAGRLLWTESIAAEEARVAALARNVGLRTERILVEARDTLERLNALEVTPCSEAHRAAMGEAAFAAPHVLQIGYWEAAERKCGAGFTEAIELKPPQADRIYDSGVIAWWPGPDTAVGDTELFLMRLGRHDVAIDPRVLLRTSPTRERRIGLWVEDLRMAAVPWQADLPEPHTLAPGLTVNQASGMLVARFSLDTVFPVDIVVTEPVGSFWQRYWPMVAVTAVAVLLLAGAWIGTVLAFTRRRLGLGAELREALASGAIEAEYQPIVALADGRCVGAEALARWRGPEGEVIPPEEFLPIAEHAGLVPQITLAVLDALLRELGDLLAARPDLRINLNLAPEDLETPRFADALAERVRNAGVPPATIKLEITERALVDSERGRELIERLRRQGHEIAIDDFGTGYSSLSYLETFSLDTLKIDKAFVDAIETEAVTSHVVHHVIAMAKDLRLDIVAEGVERQAQAAWLRERGVRHAQGYLFSEPLPPGRFRAWLDATRAGTSAAASA